MTPREIAMKCAETCERSDVMDLAEASRRIRAFALSLPSVPEADLALYQESQREKVELQDRFVQLERDLAEMTEERDKFAGQVADRDYDAELAQRPEEVRSMESAPKDRPILAFVPDNNGRGWMVVFWHRNGWSSIPGMYGYSPSCWVPLPDEPASMNIAPSKEG